MDRCAESLAVSITSSSPDGVTVDTTAHMHKHRHPCARQPRRPCLARRRPRPGSCNRARTGCPSRPYQARSPASVRSARVGRGGSLSKGRTGHIELARLHQLGERFRVNNLQTNQACPTDAPKCVSGNAPIADRMCQLETTGLRAPAPWSHHPAIPADTLLSHCECRLIKPGTDHDCSRLFPRRCQRRPADSHDCAVADTD